MLKDASSGYEGVILVEVRMILWWISKDDDLQVGVVAILSPSRIIYLVEPLLPLVLKTKDSFMQITPPAISLAEYTPYSPFLC